jgi:hypothetical protein
VHFYFLLFQGISFLVVGLDLIGEQVSWGCVSQQETMSHNKAHILYQRSSAPPYSWGCWF